MTKYKAMQARARKAGLWPISKEQAYYAGLEEGSAGHIRTDNSAVIERLERENRELRANCENLRNAGLALAFYRDDTDEYAEARRILMTEPENKPPEPVVTEGWKLVPVEPTDEMVEAALDAHMPFGDMKLAIASANLSAPKPSDSEAEQ